VRPLESLVIVFLALTLAAWVAAAGRQLLLVRAAAGGVLIALAAHLIFEGDRWPLVPTYVLAALVIGATLWAWLRRRAFAGDAGSRSKTRHRVLGGAAGLLAVAVAAVVPTLFPQIRLPEPTGPHAVGTTDLFFTDQQRAETFTPEQGNHREIWARIWYPAEAVAKGPPVAYMEHAAEVSRAITRSSRFPWFLFAHFGRVPTHAWRDAPIVREGPLFPVVVFNHAYWAGLTQSTALMEELASHGYVAVSIAHAFETPYFVRPDGRVEAFDAHNAEFALRGQERTEAYEIEQQLTTTRDTRRLAELIREVSRRRPKTVESVHIWAEDIRAVLDELARRNAGTGPLAGRLDTDRVAIMGHSFGGAAAGQACLDDPRCKAGVNLDGLQLGDMIDRSLETPFLFFHHDNAGARNRAPNLVFFEQAHAPAYLAVVAGTGHMSFSDICLHPRTSLFRLAASGGTIDGRRCQAIVNAYVLAFLDRYVRRNDTTVVQDLSESFPEVNLRARYPR
jgi:predicted dienelactone hydrolase